MKNLQKLNLDQEQCSWGYSPQSQTGVSADPMIVPEKLIEEIFTLAALLYKALPLFI